ncbi:MAG: sensor domain-containing diguanylate cyclase [Chitinivibrionia bacterium]|nr:sensor domain-containing diguanylate cyclase [Chitinivibrionia bacterium]
MGVNKNTVAEKQEHITHKRLTSIKRKFFIFSLLLLTFIIVVGTIFFSIAMKQIIKQSIDEELEQTVALGRIKLEARINSEIAIIRNMAKSPIIADYFSEPTDQTFERLARRELEAYRYTLRSESLFWINTTDKKYYRNDTLVYEVNIETSTNPLTYWYKKTLHETTEYNLNINFDEQSQIPKLWVNAPVFDRTGAPVGVIGTGIDLSDFVYVIFSEQKSRAQTFFFNVQGEITGAKDVNLVAEKRHINEVFEICGDKILSTALDLNYNEIRFFECSRSEFAVAAISEFGWFIVSTIPLVGGNYGYLMTFLFVIMSIVMVFMFLMFNIIVAKLLTPLQNMVKALNQISSDWSSPYILAKRNDEVGIIARSICDFLDQNRTLTNDVYNDALTGIYNRRFLETNMERVIKSLSRGDNELSLLFIDIDFFKKYNDTYGHQKGDECLKSVAKALTETLSRTDDFVARYGGEEFVVVLPHTDEDGAKTVAQTMIEQVRNLNITHEKNEPVGFVSISIGITTGKVSHTHNGDNYIKLADEALYKSKENGRNQYTFEALKA